MTTWGCTLVGYCKARRATLKTADFADNVLVGHLVSNQPVTGGQTSSLSPPLCGAFLGQGHILVTAGRLYRESGARAWVGCCRSLPQPGAGSDAARSPGAGASPGYHFGGCPRSPTPEDWWPATGWHRPQLSACSTPAPCPSRRDSPPPGFLLICLCNELGVCKEAGRAISKRQLVLASLARLCRCHGRGGTWGGWGAAPALTPTRSGLLGGWRVGCGGQVGDNGDCSPHNASRPTPSRPPPPRFACSPLPGSLISCLNPQGAFSGVCSPQPAPHDAQRGRTVVWKGGGGGEPCTPPRAAFFIHLPPLWHGDGAAPRTQPCSKATPRCHAFLRALQHRLCTPHPQNQCPPVGCIPRPQHRHLRRRAAHLPALPGTASPCPAQPPRGHR